MYERSGHLGQITKTNFLSLTIGCVHMKFELNWSNVFQRKCLYYCILAQKEAPWIKGQRSNRRFGTYV